ncbi:MAG: hypothetical protein GX201_11435 [Clostridiales bacterium]|nr:hypothetical protein [Clostridiales bacterium]
MKSFLETFVISLILCFIFLFFGGAFIFGNIWAILIFVSFIMAILITAFSHQETKILELEERIRALESKN